MIYLAMSVEKVKAFQSHSLTKQVAENYSTIWLLLLGVHGLCFMAGFFFRLSSMFLLMVAFIATLLLFILFKDLANEKSKLFAIRSFKVSGVLLLINLSNASMLGAMNGMLKKGQLSPGFMTLCFSVMDIILLVVSIALLSKPKFKESFDGLVNKNLFDEVLGEEIKPGDAVIGIDVDTNKPVVHPLNDRYLHYLFLGPTGSGKTALSLTPMVWRDLNSGNVGVTVIEPKGN